MTGHPCSHSPTADHSQAGEKPSGHILQGRLFLQPGNNHQWGEGKWVRIQFYPIATSKVAIQWFLRQIIIEERHPVPVLSIDQRCMHCTSFLRFQFGKISSNDVRFSSCHSFFALQQASGKLSGLLHVQMDGQNLHLHSRPWIGRVLSPKNGVRHSTAIEPV